MIEARVWQTFLDKTDEALPIHDIDIRQWGMRANKELPDPLEDFKASESWLYRFKRKRREVPNLGPEQKYDICKRRTTHVISKNQHLNAGKIAKSADEFVKNIKILISQQVQLNFFEKSTILEFRIE